MTEYTRIRIMDMPDGTKFKISGIDYIKIWLGKKNEYVGYKYDPIYTDIMNCMEEKTGKLVRLNPDISF